MADEGQVVGGAEQEVAPQVIHTEANTNTMPYEAREEVSIGALRRLLAEEAAEEENVNFRAEMDAKHPKEEEVGEISAKDVAIQKAIKANEESDEDETEEEDNDKEKTDEASKETEPETESKILEEPGEVKFKQKDILFDAAGKEIKLSNDAIVEVQVDGGVKRLRLQELLNRASGDLAIEKRYAELQSTRDKERKESQARTRLLQEKEAQFKDNDEFLKKIAALTTEGKPEQMLVHLAKKAGKDPKVAVRDFVKQTQAWADKIAGMSESQQEAWLSNVDLSIEKMAIEEEREAIKNEKAKTETLKAEETFVIYAHGELKEREIPLDEFREVEQKLLSRGFEFKTPETDKTNRFDELIDLVHEDRIFRAAREVAPELMDGTEANTRLLGSIYQQTDYWNIRSLAKIKETIAKALEKDKTEESKRLAETLSKKVRSAVTKSEKAKEANDDDVGPVSINDFMRRRRG